MTRTAAHELPRSTATSRHAARELHRTLRDLPEFVSSCTRMPTRDGVAKVKFDVLTPRSQKILDAGGWETVATRHAPETNRVFVVLDR